MANGRPNVPNPQRAIDLIWRMFIDHCDAPLTVWLDKLWPALGHLVLAWYTIDLMNIFTSFIRPKARGLGLRSARHIGGGKKGRRKGLRGLPGRALNFDPGEFIGENIPGAEDLHNRRVTPATYAMWSVYGVIERLAYYFMVLDLGGDFLYEWCSSVIKAGYCGAREDAVLLATTGTFDQIGIVSWWPVVYGETQKARNLTFWNGVGVNQIQGSGIVNFQCRGECTFSIEGDGSFGIRLNCLGGPSVGRVYEAFADVPMGSSKDLVIAGECQPGDLWITEVIVHGFFLIHESEFYLHAVWANYT